MDDEVLHTTTWLVTRWAELHIHQKALRSKRMDQIETWHVFDPPTLKFEKSTTRVNNILGDRHGMWYFIVRHLPTSVALE